MPSQSPDRKIKSMSTVTTCYGAIEQTIIDKARAIRLLICDVDGVMSDGQIYMGNQGEELKAFHVRDGYGIRCLLNAGLEVAIITGRQSQLLIDRCQVLGIKHLYQGQDNKLVAFDQLRQQLTLSTVQVAYIGDDLIDWPVMQKIGLSVAVADAHPWLLDKVDYRCQTAGGKGAVRELCDLLLIAQNQFSQAIGQSI